jgi:diphthamide synthase (EF-2-diphthine--ammonia ligase)
MRMPVLFYWSGGKDSAMALHLLLQNPDFEVISLLTSVTEEYHRINMRGVPPQCVNSIYGARMGEALLRFRDRGVRHVAFGDIFLEDLRAYREEKLAQVQMSAISPIWKVDTCESTGRFSERRVPRHHRLHRSRKARSLFCDKGIGRFFL